jgi:asparagine synthase (glutamine-hydrolysing)
VRHANDAMTHRGPDADGMFATDAGQNGVVLGHRRLAILDLSDLGRQPMLHPSGLVVVFNGEIYNYRELKPELVALGHTFQSDSDTEIILAAWSQWGQRCIERFRGMFAFALWEPARRKLHLVRDRLGKKPLYVARVERDGQPVVVFASEVRALLGTNLVPRRLDTEGLASYLWHGFVVSPRTIVEGIRSVDAATHEIIDADTGRVTVRRYWSLPRASVRPDAVEELRAELDEAVRIRLVSDVPLGVFLSGGIDSSAIAAIASRYAGGDLNTFCIGFEEMRHDESQHAEAVAKALGTKHQLLRLTADRFAADLEDALTALDQPTFDAINTYFVSRLTRESGITVALAGTGGDELFGGYAAFRDVPRALPLTRLAGFAPSSVRRLLTRAATRAAYGPERGFPPQTRWGKLGDLLGAHGRLLDVYQSTYALFTQATLEQLSVGGYPLASTVGLPAERYAQMAALADREPQLHAVSLLETVSMAVSLEARVPLLDQRVVETVAAVDPERRFQPIGRKQLLRDIALSGLDPALFERPKSGFVLPIADWCRRNLASELDRAFADDRGLASVGLHAPVVRALWTAFRSGAKGLYWSRPWSLYVLIRWCERHDVRL